MELILTIVGIVMLCTFIHIIYEVYHAEVVDENDETFDDDKQFFNNKQ